MWFLLKVLGATGAILYIGGLVKGRQKVALFGVVLLCVEFAIASFFLLRSHSYLIGGASGLVSVSIMWEILRSVRGVKK
jgi:site-specific recombinase